MTGFWGQVGVFAKRELVVERRAGEVLAITLPFGALALLLVPLAVGADLPLLARIGPALFWVVAMLFGMQVALRQSASDSPALREVQRLLSVDPAARFAGRAGASALMLTGFLGVLGLLTVVLYAPAPLPGWGWLAGVAALMATGLGMVATLAGEITTGLRTRATLAPLLVAPLAIPLLVGAVGVTESLAGGRSILAPFLLLILANLALAVAGVVVAGPLEEASR